MLDRMAELFEVPVSVLLGGRLEVEEEQPSELNEIAQQLAVLNDQLVQQAVRRRKVIRYAFVGVFAAIFVLIGAAIGLRVFSIVLYTISKNTGLQIIRSFLCLFLFLPHRLRGKPSLFNVLLLKIYKSWSSENSSLSYNFLVISF